MSDIEKILNEDGVIKLVALIKADTSTKEEVQNSFKNNNRSIEFIKTTNTAAGANLTGVSQDSALYDGKTIFLYLSYAAAKNATLNLTLSDGTQTGAKPMYYTGTSRMATQYGAGSVVSLTYVESVDGWKRAEYSVSTPQSGTLELLQEGTNTVNRVWQAKILHDYINSKSISNTEIDEIINGGD